MVVTRHQLYPDALEAAATRAKALGDPTRLALAEGEELCVCYLAWIAGRAENVVGHHLRALCTAGLARSRRDGKIIFYRLTDPGRDSVAAQLEPTQASA